MLLLEDVLVSVGPDDLLSSASLRVEPGECVGLVGNNGCGKSTLLRCIAGKRDVDAGRVAVSPEVRVGFLEQTGTGGSTRSVLEEARSRMAATAAAAALTEAEACAAAAAPATAAAAAASLQAAQDAFEAAGGASAERRVAACLDGLGFSREQWSMPCSQLSGGWQMRVALARLLLSPAGEGAAAGGGGGLLLLDEPTNHLDQRACAYLAQFLKSSGAATVLVSHDAALLEGACDRLAEVRGRALHTYVGGYAKFMEERARRAAAAATRAERLDAEAAKLEGFITRFGAKATKATAAKSKQKALDKLQAQREDDEELDAASAAAAASGPGDASRVSLRLPPPPPGAVDALELIDAAFGWGAAPQLSGVNLTLRRGTRLVVCGPNGAGKSTLLAALACALPLQRGTRKLGDGCTVGSFKQDLAQALPLGEVALDYVTHAARVAAPDTTTERVRSVLGALGLRGDTALLRIGDLSGGEKARVALAALVLRPTAILSLDEPTNHLDITALEGMTEALLRWPGAVVASTHNRAFAKALQPTHLLMVAGGSVTLQQCPTGFDDKDWDAAVAAAASMASSAAAQQPASAPQPAAPPASGSFEDRKRVQRATARLDKLMGLIEAAEAEAVLLDGKIAAAFEKGDSEAAAKLMAKKAKAEAAIVEHFAEAEELEASLGATGPSP